MWQEIIVYTIITITLFIAIRSLAKSAKNTDNCSSEDSCSTGSCGACEIADLKKDIEEAKKNKPQ